MRWLIQIPRLYEVYKANESIRTFEDIVISTSFSKVCIAWILIDIQMCLSRCLKWRKTLDLIQSYMYFCNVSLVLILSTTNRKPRGEYTRSFHIQGFGISPSRLHIRTGAWIFFATPSQEHFLKELQDLLHVCKYGELEQMETSARLQ